MAVHYRGDKPDSSAKAPKAPVVEPAPYPRDDKTGLRATGLALLTTPCVKWALGGTVAFVLLFSLWVSQVCGPRPCQSFPHTCAVRDSRPGVRWPHVRPVAAALCSWTPRA